MYAECFPRIYFLSHSTLLGIGFYFRARERERRPLRPRPNYSSSSDRTAGDTTSPSSRYIVPIFARFAPFASQIRVSDSLLAKASYTAADRPHTVRTQRAYLSNAELCDRSSRVRDLKETSRDRSVGRLRPDRSLLTIIKRVDKASSTHSRGEGGGER